MYAPASRSLCRELHMVAPGVYCKKWRRRRRRVCEKVPAAGAQQSANKFHTPGDKELLAGAECANE